MSGYLHDADNLHLVDFSTRRREHRRNEARLLAVALSRAERRVDIFTVDNDDESASPFLRYLDEANLLRKGEEASGNVERIPLDLPSVVGTLRRRTINQTASPRQRQGAASVLALLAASGIAAAHPRSWIGSGGISSDEEKLTSSHEQIRLGPSRLSQAKECLLRWFFSSMQGEDKPGLIGPPVVNSSYIGTLVHLLAEKHPDGDWNSIKTDFDHHWEESGLDDGSWWAGLTYRRTEEMLQRMSTYFQQTAGKVDTEKSFHLDLVDAVLSGSIDRIEHHEDGSVEIIDIKTTKTAPTAKQVEENQQLLAYQLALYEQGLKVRGAALLTVAAPAAKGNIKRSQSALSSEEATSLKNELEILAETMAGPRYLATINANCRHCPFVASCPAQEKSTRGLP